MTDVHPLGRRIVHKVRILFVDSIVGQVHELMFDVLGCWRLVFFSR